MRRTDPTARLAELHSIAERIAANLVDLEIDSSRQLLEASTLAGLSAERWSAASATLTELWRRRSLLDALLERADTLASPRRAAELSELLEGRSIELASNDVPIGERNLLGAAHADDRCTVHELLTGMSAAFDEVKATITEIAGAWERLVPQIDAVRRLHTEAAGLAGELGGLLPPELARATAALEAITSTITTDPLSAKPGEIAALGDELGSLRDELAGSLALKQGFEGSVLAARGLIGRLQVAVAESLAAREELVLKIAAAPAAPAPATDQREALEANLQEIVEIARAGDWRAAQRALAELTARTESMLDAAHRSRDASRAPVAARNQFRGLLEAYRIKAARLGQVEDPKLAEIFARAEAVLYTAPTDLALAAQLVRSYQEAIR